MRHRFGKYNKYGNKITVVDGIKFRSKKEAKRWCELKLLEMAGAIRNLRRQVRYDIEINGIKVCQYVSDFEYDDGKQEFVEDCKGMRTYEYQLKAKLMKACYGIEILET